MIDGTTPETEGMWSRLLTDGRHGTLLDVELVAPGDVVFLDGPTRVAFPVEKIIRQDGRTLLFLTSGRYWQVGGASRMHMEFALRGTDEGDE